MTQPEADAWFGNRAELPAPPPDDLLFTGPRARAYNFTVAFRKLLIATNLRMDTTAGRARPTASPLLCHEPHHGAGLEPEPFGGKHGYFGRDDGYPLFEPYKRCLHGGHDHGDYPAEPHAYPDTRRASSGRLKRTGGHAAAKLPKGQGPSEQPTPTSRAVSGPKLVVQRRAGIRRSMGHAIQATLSSAQPRSPWQPDRPPAPRNRPGGPGDASSAVARRAASRLIEGACASKPLDSRAEFS